MILVGNFDCVNVRMRECGNVKRREFFDTALRRFPTPKA